MPSITMLEDDITKGTGSSNTDIAFIPGFAADPDVAKNVLNRPILFTSVQDFEDHYGPVPLIHDDDIDDLGVKAGDPDKSYIMAKELINSGMPVYYYAVPNRIPIKCSLFKDGKSIVENLTNYNFENIEINSSSGSTTTLTLKFEPALDVTRGSSFYIDFSSSYSSSEISIGSELYYNDTEIQASSYYSTDDCTTDGWYSITASNKFSVNTINLHFILTGDVSNSISSEGIFNLSKGASANLATSLFSCFSDDILKDKGECDFKYLTSGGYPNFDSTTASNPVTTNAQKMITLAKDRQDCVALIEDKHNENPLDLKNFFKALQKANLTYREFGSAFYPYANYALMKPYEINSIKHNECVLPACFGYLLDLSSNVKVSPNWLAMAGTTRGRIPNILNLDLSSKILTNSIADSCQPSSGVALNCITNIKPYGLCIWGNRTLLPGDVDNGLKASNFLNTRNMISDIKKLAYSTAKKLQFEQKDENLWLRFKSGVTPFLEQLKLGSGISSYKLIKMDTKYNKKPVGKQEFACAIKIVPIYAVEDFEITVVIADDDVSVG